LTIERALNEEREKVRLSYVLNELSEISRKDFFKLGAFGENRYCN
jgi:hypothetical protein